MNALKPEDSSASEGARTGVPRVVYLEDAKVAQIATDGPLRAVLGDLMGSLVDCVGGCGFRLLSQHHWEQFDKPKRKHLRELGVRRKDSANRCWKCIENGVAPGESMRNTRRKLSTEMLSRLPEIWNEVRESGGGQRELGEALGVSRERARQLIKEHSLPRTHSLKEKAAVFLEELEHLAGLGMGVQYISRALGMDPDALVKKVDHLHQTGKTKVRFEGWHRRCDKEAA